MASSIYKLERPPHPAPTGIMTGVVHLCEPLTVRGERGLLRCERAFSCILIPALGDKVLYVTCDDRTSYVLAILERGSGARLGLAFEGDVHLKIARGRLLLNAENGIDLASPADISLLSSAINVAAGRGDVTVGELNHSGASLNAVVGRVKLVATRFESVVETLTQWIARSFRRVDQHEHITTRNTQYHCDELFALDSRNTIVMSEELAKIDAGQIHLG
ncbi:MAG: DUF3540 domain-containing protein [Candidatus Binataceae bacterium]